jgi:hypothetical protein
MLELRGFGKSALRSSLAGLAEAVRLSARGPSQGRRVPSQRAGHGSRDTSRYTSRMAKFIIAAIVVFAVLVGGLIGLLRGRRAPLAPPDVLDRAKQRNRELEAQERREGED